jgi:hypothetical protein
MEGYNRHGFDGIVFGRCLLVCEIFFTIVVEKGTLRELGFSGFIDYYKKMEGLHLLEALILSLLLH